jgi:hypothetical protein
MLLLVTFLFQTVCYDPSVGLNILLLDEASGIDMHPLMPSTKILQWQLGQNLQCKGVSWDRTCNARVWFP